MLGVLSDSLHMCVVRCLPDLCTVLPVRARRLYSESVPLSLGGRAICLSMNLSAKKVYSVYCVPHLVLSTQGYHAVQV